MELEHLVIESSTNSGTHGDFCRSGGRRGCGVGTGHIPTAVGGLGGS